MKRDKEVSRNINRQAVLDTIKATGPTVFVAIGLKIFGIDNHTTVTISLVLSAVVGYIFFVATAPDSGY